MALGWGVGKKVYDTASKPAEGLADASAQAYSRVKGENVEVDPNYETVVKPKLEAAKRKREAKELKRAAIDGIKKYNAEVEHRRRLRSDDREYEVEAQKEALSQYLNTRKDSKALNKVFEAVGAPVRSYEDFSGNARPAYQDTVINPYGPLWSHTREASEYFDKNGPEALPGAAGQLYLGNSAEEQWIGHNDAYPNYQAGHFLSSPYHTKEWVADDVKYRKTLLNPFTMKSAPSKGAWAQAEWTMQNPELAAKRVMRKLGKGGGSQEGGSQGRGGASNMPQTDELREEEYTRGGPDYTSAADDAEALLARYADLDRGYKGEHLSPETQAQAEELRRLQADAEAEGETVEHEAAETPQQEASEEDGYEEEGEVIPDDDMEGPVIPDGERLDSPQSLVAERAAAVGAGLEEAAKGASELTETQKLDAYIRKSVEDWAKSTGRDYEGLFAKSTPKQAGPAASPRPAPRTGAPAAETRVQTNGGQRRQDLEREASGYRNQGGGASARPNPPVKPVEKPKVGRFDDGVPLVDTPPLGFYTPSGSKVPVKEPEPSGSKVSVKEPEYVDRRTADPRVSEGMNRSEATGWRAKGGAAAMGIPTAGVMAAPAVQLATGIGRTLKDAREAGQSGARVGEAQPPNKVNLAPEAPTPRVNLAPQSPKAPAPKAPAPKAPAPKAPAPQAPAPQAPAPTPRVNLAPQAPKAPAPQAPAPKAKAELSQPANRLPKDARKELKKASRFVGDGKKNK